MEKAKLIVRETKKKKIIAELHFVDLNKTMPFPQFKPKDTSLNGKEVDVEREKGKIISVNLENRPLYSSEQADSDRKPSRPKRSDVKPRFEDRKPRKETHPVVPQNPSAHVEEIHYAAHAPYNFVPLNEKLVEAPDTLPSFDQYHTDRNTGWIDLDIETKTPLYIRGTLTEEQVKAGKESKDISAFFAPGGKLQIPGSSLRGMIRQLVEIVSFGKFVFYDDKRLYFRGLADKSNIRKEYQNKMTSFDKEKRRPVYNVSAGVLRKKRFNAYEIVPSPSYRQILKKDAQAKIGKKYREFSFYKLDNEYLVVSGNMQNKKRDWLIEFPAQGAIPIPIAPDDVYNYHDDITRADSVPNLIRMTDKQGEIPCFYVTWQDSQGNKRVSFGHTAMFRLAYTKTIGEHIPESLKDSKKFDIPEAIFGNEKTFAGRVFFEDALLCDDQTDVLMGERTPKILSSPKPTTFQHYLTQYSDNNRRLNHYNTDAPIRGNKLYWHKSGEDWEETDQQQIQKHKTQYTKINPVSPGKKFGGRVRFENLSDVELGALLFVLDLPEGCLHKLGMGKPLGLGSVKITPTLYLSNREKRYTELFHEWDNTCDQSDRIDDLKKTFGHYVSDKIGDSKRTTLWQTARLQELEIMLNYKKGLERQMKNIYMQITPKNEFKNRPVLPLPSKV